MTKKIEISESVQKNINAVKYNKLMADIETIKTINAETTEIIGKSKHGFNFKKFLNCIVIF